MPPNATNAPIMIAGAAEPATFGGFVQPMIRKAISVPKDVRRMWVWSSNQSGLPARLYHVVVVVVVEVVVIRRRIEGAVGQ